MGTFLIILGIFCLMTTYGVNAPIPIILGCFFIIWGIYLKLKKPRNGQVKSNRQVKSDSHTGYEGHVQVDNTQFIYGDDGELYDVDDGSFTQGLDGRYYDNYGHIVDVDNDGDLHMY